MQRQNIFLLDFNTTGTWKIHLSQWQLSFHYPGRPKKKHVKQSSERLSSSALGRPFLPALLGSSSASSTAVTLVVPSSCKGINTAAFASATPWWFMMGWRKKSQIYSTSNGPSFFGYNLSWSQDWYSRIRLWCIAQFSELTPLNFQDRRIAFHDRMMKLMWFFGRVLWLLLFLLLGLLLVNDTWKAAKNGKVGPLWPLLKWYLFFTSEAVNPSPPESPGHSH